MRDISESKKVIGSQGKCSCGWVGNEYARDRWGFHIALSQWEFGDHVYEIGARPEEGDKDKYFYLATYQDPRGRRHNLTY